MSVIQCIRFLTRNSILRSTIGKSGTQGSTKRKNETKTLFIVKSKKFIGNSKSNHDSGQRVENNDRNRHIRGHQRYQSGVLNHVGHRKHVIHNKENNEVFETARKPMKKSIVGYSDDMWPIEEKLVKDDP